jgi:cytochrome d ubiquinol oxidase subunit I
MEAHWETTANAPKHLFAIPDEEKERNIVQLFPVPGMLSLLATRPTSGVVKGLKAFPKEDRPPDLISFAAFNTMVALGFYFAIVTIMGWSRAQAI